MHDPEPSGGRHWLLDELAVAQGELVQDLASAMKRVRAARRALATATDAGLGPDAVCFVDADGRSVTVEELRGLFADADAIEVPVGDGSEAGPLSDAGPAPAER